MHKNSLIHRMVGMLSLYYMSKLGALFQKMKNDVYLTIQMDTISYK